MDPGVIIAGMVLVLVVALAIGYPFLARPREGASPVGVHTRQLRERKEQVLAAIKELQFDNELGKVSAADYLHLRAPLEEEALRLMHALDECSGHSEGEPLRQRLETEVRARRRGLQPGTDQYCSRCHAVRRLADRFCPQCGAQHQEVGN